MIRHTEYLISRNDCVIIPGLGAVLARYEHAKVDAEHGYVCAPRRVLAFNGALSHSDGMLACSVSKALGIPYSLASERVAAEVEAMNRQLRHDGQLALGRIGTLTFNAEADALDFSSAGEEGCLSVATAWLPDVCKRAPAVKPAAEAGSQCQASVERTSSWAWRRLARAAASIAVLIGICFVASTPIAVDDAALASLSPEIKHTPVEELLPAEALQPVPSISLVASHLQGAVIGIDSLMSKPEAPSERDKKNFGAAYLVIVGSFGNVDDARAYIASQSSDRHLRILERDGRVRVCSAAYPTSAEAYADIQANKYADTGAWVYKY